MVPLKYPKTAEQPLPAKNHWVVYLFSALWYAGAVFHRSGSLCGSPFLVQRGAAQEPVPKHGRLPLQLQGRERQGRTQRLLELRPDIREL